MYYYLKPDDVIQQGDEFKFKYDEDFEFRPCRSSVGGTLHSQFSTPTIIRRLIKQTKKGNSLY